jgi:glucokinase
VDASPAHQAGPRLLGDVGGTNARFAWQAEAGAPIEAVAAYRCADFATLEAAIRHYLAERRLGRPVQAAIGIANPVLGDQVQMTNHHWHFSIEALRRSFGLARLRVLNDFAALALALPVLDAQELHAVGGGTATPGGTRALIGPGTGLGVSALVHGGSRPDAVISGEGGHVTLAAADDEEAAVLAKLRAQFGHVSAERVLSGAGLENLHRAWGAVQGRVAPERSAAEIVQRAMAGSDADCAAVVELFLGFLGNVAGNLALTFGATGGVYLGGGIVPRLGAAIGASRFRRRFEAKGRFATYLQAIPVWVIDASGSPALRGAARALEGP